MKINFGIDKILFKNLQLGITMNLNQINLFLLAYPTSTFYEKEETNIYKGQGNNEKSLGTKAGTINREAKTFYREKKRVETFMITTIVKHQ